MRWIAQRCSTFNDVLFLFHTVALLSSDVVLVASAAVVINSKSSLSGVWSLKTDALPFLYTTATASTRRQLHSIRTQEDPWVITSSQPHFGQASDTADKFKATHPQQDSSSSLPTILLQLNPDGRFRQCNENYQEGRWMKGRWDIVGGKACESDKDPSTTCDSLSTDDTVSNDHDGVGIRLALDRQYFGPPCDTLLEGRVRLSHSNGRQLEGQVYQGKFAKSKNHPDFFYVKDAARKIVPTTLTGGFVMEQVVATTSLESSTPTAASIDDDKINNAFQSVHQSTQSTALDHRYPLHHISSLPFSHCHDYGVARLVLA